MRESARTMTMKTKMWEILSKRHCTIMYYLLVEYQTLPYSLDQKLFFSFCKTLVENDSK